MGHRWGARSANRAGGNGKRGTNLGGRPAGYAGWVLLALLACSASINPRDNFDRPELIRIGVEGVVPPGTGAEEAAQRMEGLGYTCESARGEFPRNCPGNEGPNSTAPDSVGDCTIMAAPHVLCTQQHGPAGWFGGAQTVEVYLAVGDGGVLVMAWYESAFVL